MYLAKGFVDLPCFGFKLADLDFDSSGAQLGKALSRNRRIGILLQQTTRTIPAAITASAKGRCGPDASRARD